MNDLKAAFDIAKNIGKVEAKMDAMDDENEQLQARVEELERERNDAIKQNLRDLKYANGHHITDEQIDEAWEYTQLHSNQYVKDEVGTALNKLHIFKCERCGGKGWVDYHTGLSCTKNCPACNGHGWAIRNRRDAGPCQTCNERNGHGWVIK